MSRGLASILVLSSFACRAAQPVPAVPDIAAVRTELDSLWARYAAAAVVGDADALARMYTAEPYLVESGIPTARTNAELLAVAKKVLGSVDLMEAIIQPEITEFAGDQVLQFGTYRDVLQAPGQPVQVVHGRFSAVLVRDSASAWRVNRLIAVADSTVAQKP